MALVQEMGYVAYGVRDLERATSYFRDVCQLEVSERVGGTVFLTGDERHHWVRLEERSEPGLIRLGYRAVSPQAIDEVAARLDNRGVAYERVDDYGGSRIVGGLRFRTPHGVEFELYDQMLSLPGSPAPQRGISCLLHAVMFVPDMEKELDFYTEVLGFLQSDRIEDIITFLRCGNQYHHALALAPGATTELDHIAMLVDDIEDVLAFRAHGNLMGTLAGDVVKHVGSTSVSIYLNDPEVGVNVEYCNGHAKIADDSYRGRLLKAGPTTANAWAAGFPVSDGSTFQRIDTTTSGGGTKAGALTSEPVASESPATGEPAVPAR